MFRVGIAPDKAEDADGLAPIKDDNAVWHNSRRNRLKVFMGVQYQTLPGPGPVWRKLFNDWSNYGREAYELADRFSGWGLSDD